MLRSYQTERSLKIYKGILFSILAGQKSQAKKILVKIDILDAYFENLDVLSMISANFLPPFGEMIKEIKSGKIKNMIESLDNLIQKKILQCKYELIELKYIRIINAFKVIIRNYRYYKMIRNLISIKKLINYFPNHIVLEIISKIYNLDLLKYIFQNHPYIFPFLYFP